ncbi:hypothetical protein Slin15195_G050690 [Septoria linicola]|uniref:Uncharacterized protein n=1 Tax=Septoria linicola TaxID=215465 RepID=A0A9Q9EI80_9PEZI|nr:hypothetical protein Slin15195_G050690 [Septoria linicola]
MVSNLKNNVTAVVYVTGNRGDKRSKYQGICGLDQAVNSHAIRNDMIPQGTSNEKDKSQPPYCTSERNMLRLTGIDASVRLPPDGKRKPSVSSSVSTYKNYRLSKSDAAGIIEGFPT